MSGDVYTAIGYLVVRLGAGALFTGVVYFIFYVLSRLKNIAQQAEWDRQEHNRLVKRVVVLEVRQYEKS